MDLNRAHKCLRYLREQNEKMAETGIDGVSFSGSYLRGIITVMDWLTGEVDRYEKSAVEESETASVEVAEADIASLGHEELMGNSLYAGLVKRTEVLSEGLNMVLNDVNGTRERLVE